MTATLRAAPVANAVIDRLKAAVGPAGYIVDTDHVVGFTTGLNYQVTKVGGLKSLFLSGEGLVCRFQGQGRLWISTRAPGGLASFLHPFRRVKAKSN